MHPFDGTEPFICLRINNGVSLFDLPITAEQLSIITANIASNNLNEEEEEEEDTVHSYEPTNESFTPTTYDSDTIVLNSNVYAMGAGSDWDEDDDL